MGNYSGAGPQRLNLDKNAAENIKPMKLIPIFGVTPPVILISVHIPKCAGTSFRTALRSSYRERLWENYGRIFSREQARAGLVPAGTRCIHGHFLADAFDGLFPRREIITWLRHPVERVVSTYYHFLRTPDLRDDCCRALYEHKLTLREFADLDWMCNTAGRYAAGKVFSDFAFIGIVERFEESMLRFHAQFGGATELPMPKNNVNPARSLSGNLVSPADRAYILTRNERDCAWYEQARTALDHPAPRRKVFSPPAGLPRIPSTSALPLPVAI
jgi:hypothetical protein